jgi:hypothetical protein
MRLWVSARKAITRKMAAADSIRMPLEYTSRWPR